MTKLKICGLTRLADIAAVNDALPSYIGFVFAPSRRRVTPEQAAELRRALDPRVIPVGVFVSEPSDAILRLFDAGVIALAQLHGGEDERSIETLKNHGVPVLQAIRSGRGDTPSRLADFHLFDAPAAGSGQAFDWREIPEAGKPYFLAGGIDETNLAAALALAPYAVDISSGAETDGLKDPAKIKKFVKQVENQ